VRAKFVGPNGDRLEIIRVGANRFQYIYLHEEDRGISRVVSSPLAPLVREAIAAGWKRLPDDPAEIQQDLIERRRLAWLAGINPNFTPTPPKPKPKSIKRVHTVVEELLEIPPA